MKKIAMSHKARNSIGDWNPDSLPIPSLMSSPLHLFIHMANLKEKKYQFFLNNRDNQDPEENGQFAREGMFS